MKNFKDFLQEEKIKGCPAATQDYLEHIQNKGEAIHNEKKAYGPMDPTVPNVTFWEEKAQVWKVEPGIARTRICSACEYFDESAKTQNCVKDGQTLFIIQGMQNLTGWNAHAGRVAYCTKHKFIADELRSCNGWESKEKKKGETK